MNEQLETLFKYIENKNIGDIADYLEKLALPDDKKAIILKLPLLYGEPKTVLKQMEALCINNKMRQVVEKISEIKSYCCNQKLKSKLTIKTCDTICSVAIDYLSCTSREDFATTA